MFIEDGSGSGHRVAISEGNKLRTYGVMESEEWHMNEDLGLTYSLVVSQTPAGANDCFCYIKNTSDYDLIITTMKAYVPTDETIQIKFNDAGTPAGGTTGVPVNRNAGSGNTIDATVVVGNDITGLSGGAVVDQLFFNGTDTAHKFSWGSGLIVPRNKTMSFYAVTGSILVNATLSMHYHGKI